MWCAGLVKGVVRRVARGRYRTGILLSLFLLVGVSSDALGDSGHRYIVRFKKADSSTAKQKSLSIEPSFSVSKAQLALPLDNSVVVTLSDSEREALVARADVESIEVDAKVKAFFDPNDTAYPEQYALSGTYGIRAPLAWDITRGSTRKLVAIIDSGIDFTHEDLQETIWTNPGEVASNGIDDDANGYIDDIRGYDFGSDLGDSDPTDEMDTEPTLQELSRRPVTTHLVSSGSPGTRR